MQSLGILTVHDLNEIFLGLKQEASMEDTGRNSRLLMAACC